MASGFLNICMFILICFNYNLFLKEVSKQCYSNGIFPSFKNNWEKSFNTITAKTYRYPFGLKIKDKKN